VPGQDSTVTHRLVAAGAHNHSRQHTATARRCRPAAAGGAWQRTASVCVGGMGGAARAAGWGVGMDRRGGWRSLPCYESGEGGGGSRTVRRACWPAAQAAGCWLPGQLVLWRQGSPGVPSRRRPASHRRKGCAVAPCMSPDPGTDTSRHSNTPCTHSQTPSTTSPWPIRQPDRQEHGSKPTSGRSTNAYDLARVPHLMPIAASTSISNRRPQPRWREHCGAGARSVHGKVGQTVNQSNGLTVDRSNMFWQRAGRWS
jgi:hypothetical protein